MGKKICFAFNHLQYSDGVARAALSIANRLAEEKDCDVTLRPIFIYDPDIKKMISPKVKIKPLFGFWIRGMVTLFWKLPGRLMHALVFGTKHEYDIEVGFQHGPSTVAAVSSHDNSTQHYVWIHTYDDSLLMRKQYAKADLNIIDEMFTEYKNFESEALAITGTGLSNAKGAGQLCDETLNSFMQERSINTRESAANYEQIQRNKLIGEGFESYYKSFRSARNEIEDAVSNWSVMQIPSKAKQIEDLATSASKHLTELSNEAKLPVIENSGSRFTITGYQSKNFSVDTNNFMFKKKLVEASGFSVTALLVVLLIHFLILFNYIVAYRTDKIAVGRYSQNDGGRAL